MTELPKQAQQFIDALPHAKALGLQIVSLGGGEAVLTMPYDEKLVGDPKSGVIHGGAISTVIDTCCGAAVMSNPGVAGASATLDLRIDYMRAATPGQSITARAHCYHITRTVAFVRATATDDDSGRPVATASGAFTVGAG
ncbi:thioesterase [Pseudooceanicola lipolyticus]|uniref:Thioesterase n=1 Tax=Pseudooceanicola lipolyticus TaxID=2029104 RepID=A0A2M8J005_9RHOB|nr:PaaI family thioesterase [Pseudooceanicola lipolyticus]PJE36102.1 thioesterase [Pseudooceanicola lipolyticus]